MSSLITQTTLNVLKPRKPKNKLKLQFNSVCLHFTNIYPSLVHIYHVALCVAVAPETFVVLQSQFARWCVMAIFEFLL